MAIPRAATHHRRDFRLPSCVALGPGPGESKEKIEPDVQTVEPPDSTAERQPIAAPRRAATTQLAPERIAATANATKPPAPDASRFRDRTLSWFQAGEEGVEIPEGEYADAPRARSWLRSAAAPLAVGAIALGAAIWWLL